MAAKDMDETMKRLLSSVRLIRNQKLEPLCTESGDLGGLQVSGLLVLGRAHSFMAVKGHLFAGKPLLQLRGSR